MTPFGTSSTGILATKSILPNIQQKNIIVNAVTREHALATGLLLQFLLFLPK